MVYEERTSAPFPMKGGCMQAKQPNTASFDLVDKALAGNNRALEELLATTETLSLIHI